MLSCKKAYFFHLIIYFLSFLKPNLEVASLYCFKKNVISFEKNINKDQFLENKLLKPVVCKP